MTCMERWTKYDGVQDQEADGPEEGIDEEIRDGYALVFGVRILD